MKNIKNIVIYVAIIIISLLFIFVGHNAFKAVESTNDDMDVYKAKIISIDDIEEEQNEFSDTVTNKTIHFKAKITSGDKKSSVVSATQNIDSMFLMQDKEINQDDSILIAFTDYGNGEKPDWIFVGYNRIDALIYLCMVFLLLIVIIGREKGVNTIISLILTCLVIFMVYIPSILSGFNVYVSTIIVGGYIILMSLLIINGANKKTLCAILGNLSGVVIAGLLALLMNNILKFTGIIDEHYVYLTYVNPDNPINLISIIWRGIVLGSLGAIMDVAMTIASSMNELAEHMGRRTFAKMLRSGMNIGRDSIGTMTNTLILAYIGSSLALVLLLIVNTKNTLYLFSMEMIAVEVVQAVVGSIGILFAVPFTAIFAAYIFNKKTV